MRERLDYLLGVSLENRMALATSACDRVIVAARRLVDVLLNNGKFFVIGEDYTVAHAGYFCTILLHHFELARPALPAIPLIQTLHGPEHVSYTLQALGRVEDVCILLGSMEKKETLTYAIRAAHEQGMSLVALIPEDHLALPLLRDEDTIVCIPGETRMSLNETHLFVLNALCDLIEQSLFGPL